MGGGRGVMTRVPNRISVATARGGGGGAVIANFFPIQATGRSYIRGALEQKGERWRGRLSLPRSVLTTHKTQPDHRYLTSNHRSHLKNHQIH